MATRRIVPNLDVSDYTVNFTDGGRVLPDWQFALLPKDVKYIDLTYEEWVKKVADKSFEKRALGHAIGELLERQFQR